MLHWRIRQMLQEPVRCRAPRNQGRVSEAHVQSRRPVDPFERTYLLCEDCKINYGRTWQKRANFPGAHSRRVREPGECPYRGSGNVHSHYPNVYQSMKSIVAESRAVKMLREVFESGRPLTYLRCTEEQRAAKVLGEVSRRLSNSIPTPL